MTRLKKEPNMQQLKFSQVMLLLCTAIILLPSADGHAEDVDIQVMQAIPADVAIFVKRPYVRQPRNSTPPKKVAPKVTRLKLKPGHFYLDLQDQSRVIGTLIDTPHISVQLSFGKLDFPIERVKTIRMLDATQQVQVFLTNGDHMTGKLLMEKFQVTTAYGQMVVQVGEVKVFSNDVSNTTTHPHYGTVLSTSAKPSASTNNRPKPVKVSTPIRTIPVFQFLDFSREGSREMHHKTVYFCTWIALGLLLSCDSANTAEYKKIKNSKENKKVTTAMEKIRPLHKKMGKPQDGDWLKSHKEDGQTYDEYLKSSPVTPNGRRKVIYIQPIGDFSKTEKKIIDKTIEFIGHYYQREVKTLKTLPLDVIPEKAQRKHPTQGIHQILSTYVLDDLLKPELPKDAAALIAFTNSDLWPGRGWNFVFGQASLRDRVGVWSMKRNGDPTKGEKEFRLCLLRTVKTATHEIGHMFSIQHCTAYECNMCGSNSRTESDRRPVSACPECIAKIWWATGCDPIKRYEQLAKFCKANGLEEEFKFYTKSATTLKADAQKNDK